MQQLASVWNGLEPGKRMIVALATVAMFAAVLFLSRMATEPSLSLLYAGMESGSAGEVVAALEQRGAVYEVRGDSIYVDAGMRDELRMLLASEGLPANASTGYELLDGMSGFGTTSQMFDAAYWRAKEGELARTIVSSTHIRAARVHISNTNTQPFRRESRPTASVTVTTTTGTLSPTHARALKYLIASAVTGMHPGDVSVIDSEGGLMLGGDEDPSLASGTDRAAELKENVQQMLEARVGYGKVVVEVSVETETDSVAISEKSFDPASRVVISTDTEQTSTNSKDEKPAPVTVASNLPQGDATAGGSSQSQNSESRERTNFEVSETQREIVQAPGAIKRISVAVLVDGVRGVDANGAATWTPRPDEELQVLRDLVGSAVGFDEQRGDVITLKSLEFQPVADAGTLVEASFFDGLNFNLMSLIQLLVLALVAVALGLFVIRPILSSRPADRLPDPASAGALPAPDKGGTVLNGEIDDGLFDLSNLPVISADDGSDLGGNLDTDPVARLRRLIAERQDETVEILRSWMDDRQEKV